MYIFIFYNNCPFPKAFLVGVLDLASVLLISKLLKNIINMQLF